jgi:hypothetical protein
MTFSIAVTGIARQAALQRALDVYNAKSPAITQEQFLQKLIDVDLDGLALNYLVKNITNLQFLDRFTSAERIAIRTAAQSNGEMADYLAMQAAADGIDLTDARTIGGVQALEAAGLIAAGRAAEILAL